MYYESLKSYIQKNKFFTGISTKEANVYGGKFHIRRINRIREYLHF